MNRISDRERAYVLEVLDNGFSRSKNNIFNERLEQAFSIFTGVKYCIGHVNGTSAMHTALASLGVMPGDEVLISPLTMAAPAYAILHNASIPVFADVDINTFNISADAAAACIGMRTRALIGVGLYGLLPDYKSIAALCKPYDIYLIEDNAQCFYAAINDSKAGAFGHFAAFSFQSSKHLSCGEGGMLCCQHQDFADKARQFSGLGFAGLNAANRRIRREEIQNPEYSRHVAMGFNYRMSELNAAVALGQLENAVLLTEKRIEVARLYSDATGDSMLVKQQFVPGGYRHTYWTFPLVLRTDNPQQDWIKFRNLFVSYGGESFYGAWKLTCYEPFFNQQVQHYHGIRQHYEPGLCPNAEYLQPRLMQLKTNFLDMDEAKKQADALHKTINMF